MVGWWDPVTSSEARGLSWVRPTVTVALPAATSISRPSVVL